MRTHAPDGHAPPEYALATPRGVKAPDVVWMSPDRRQKMRETGDPSTLAPEICVEVVSASNTEEEMQAKRQLYRTIGAEEVWVVSEDGTIRFFGEEERGLTIRIYGAAAFVTAALTIVNSLMG